jgi:uncharacterized membrane protein YhaH (DUF805 family)
VKLPSRSLFLVLFAPLIGSALYLCTLTPAPWTSQYANVLHIGILLSLLILFSLRCKDAGKPYYFPLLMAIPIIGPVWVLKVSFFNKSKSN